MWDSLDRLYGFLYAFVDDLIHCRKYSSENESKRAKNYASMDILMGTFGDVLLCIQKNHRKLLQYFGKLPQEFLPA